MRQALCGARDTVMNKTALCPHRTYVLGEGSQETRKHIR